MAKVRHCTQPNSDLCEKSMYICVETAFQKYEHEIDNFICVNKKTIFVRYI